MYSLSFKNVHKGSRTEMEVPGKWIGRYCYNFIGLPLQYGLHSTKTTVNGDSSAYHSIL